MKFCGNCGEPLKLRCPNCGFANPPAFNFCGNCGTSLAEVARAASSAGSAEKNLAAPSRPTNDAERRQLTVLFCDLAGSTALSERLDPETLREVLHDYQLVCAEVIRHYEGYIARYFGDGILVYFGYPIAHEEDAQRAVLTGLGIVEKMAPLNARLLRECGLELDVRIGIHTGLVVAGDMDQSENLESMAIIGETPNIAARLQGLADLNAVLVSLATYRLVRQKFEFRDLGPRRLKGSARPMQVFQVLEERSQVGGSEGERAAPLSPFVGRDQEVHKIMARWERVRAGRGQVVLIGGETGIGKSRLVLAVQALLVGESAGLRTFQCSPFHRNSTLYPISQALPRWFGFEPGESDRAKLKKIESALRQAGINTPEAVAVLGGLLALDLDDEHAALQLPSQRQRELTFKTLLNLLTAAAARQPLLLIFEDLHWADASSLDWLDLVLNQIRSVPILVLLTFGPAFRIPWTRRSHMLRLDLTGLSGQSSEAIVNYIAGDGAISDDLMRQIFAQTDGVPLFVEELTKMVLESDHLQDGREFDEPGGPLSVLEIPTTLREALTARFDQLGPIKEIAQLAATLGRSFQYKLLRAISTQDEARLKTGLAQLVAADFLAQRGVLPHAEFSFKHALIQEVAYHTMLRSRRREVHGRVARTLLERFPEVSEIQPEQVAYHFTQAGLAEEAIPLWQQAGERAAHQSGHVEARAHFRKALSLLASQAETPERDEIEMALVVALAESLMATQGYGSPEAAKALNRARELTHKIGETPRLPTALLALSVTHLIRSEFDTAEELAQGLLHLADRKQTPFLTLPARFVLGSVAFFRGNHAPARDQFEQGLANYDTHLTESFLDVNPYINCLGHSAWTLWCLGYADQAAKRSQESLARAGERPRSLSMAAALVIAAMFHQFQQTWKKTQKLADEAIALCEAQGYAYYLAFGKVLRGWALSMQGHTGQGLGLVRRGFESWDATGATLLRPWFLSALAESHFLSGNLAAARGLISDALQTLEGTGERFYEAELHRLQGDFMRAEPASSGTAGSPGEIEACYRRALSVAQEQQAQPLALRAAVSLADLQQETGGGADGLEILSRIHQKIEEGFETPDLVAAKKLLG